MSSVPCYGCGNHSEGCHSNCEKYISWKEERQKILDKKSESHNIQYALSDIRNRGYKKTSAYKRKK